MFEIRSNCPYCKEEITVGLYHRFVRPFKLVQCPECKNYSTFDFFRNIGPIWACIIFMLYSVVFTFPVLVLKKFPFESKVLIFLSTLVFGYLSHLVTKNLKKIGTNATDIKPQSFESKWNRITFVVGLIIGIIGYIISALMFEFALGLLTVK